MRWPIRRRLVGGIEGRQARAPGIALSQSPREPPTTRAAHTTNKESKGPRPFASQQPALREAQHVSASHDQVIQHLHVHQRQRSLQRLRQVFIGPRRLR